jgi:hypothetical protein
MTRLKVPALVGLYLAAIVAANQLVVHYGAKASVVTAFGLIGLDLCTRDALQTWWYPHPWAKLALLIASGSGLSYLLNASNATATVALASAVAFASSEALEGAVYHLARRRPWIERANVAAIFGAAIDSVLFVSIAFGFDWQIVTAQSFAKLAGCFVWSLLIVWLLPSRRAQPVPA